MYPQTMINVRLAKGASAHTVCADPTVSEIIKHTEADLGDKGRVLLRPSGTEPVIRVMVEGEDAKQVESACQKVAEVVEAQI